VFFPLQNGDIINIDVNVFLNVSNALYYVYNLYACRTLQQVSYIPQQGYHGGTSRTFVCGKVDDSINHFLKVSYP
jgi:methionyl aminopeptidase